MKRNKTAEKEMEELNIEALPPSPFFEDIPNAIPPIQPAPFGEEEIEEPLEDLELEVAEEGLTEEREELEIDQKLLEKEALFHPQDITWEYLKGLEKISLLTPEKEVDLAKRIKEGERQVKLFEIRTSRLKTQIYSINPKNGKKKPQNGTKQSLKLKGKNGKNRQKIENIVL